MSEIWIFGFWTFTVVWISGIYWIQICPLRSSLSFFKWFSEQKNCHYFKSRFKIYLFTTKKAEKGLRELNNRVGGISATLGIPKNKFLGLETVAYQINILCSFILQLRTVGVRNPDLQNTDGALSRFWHTLSIWNPNARKLNARQEI